MLASVPISICMNFFKTLIILSSYKRLITSLFILQILDLTLHMLLIIPITLMLSQLDIITKLLLKSNNISNKTFGKWIFLIANSDIQFKAFSDSDWVRCVDSQISITTLSIIYQSYSLISCEEIICIKWERILLFWIYTQCIIDIGFTIS